MSKGAPGAGSPPMVHLRPEVPGMAVGDVEAVLGLEAVQPPSGLGRWALALTFPTAGGVRLGGL